MGLSKPVITTEADISGITSTLAEIKGAVQENSGGTDAPVIGSQFGYADFKGNTAGSLTKIMSGNGSGKLVFSVNCTTAKHMYGFKFVVDGAAVINRQPTGQGNEGMFGVPFCSENYTQFEIPFSESFEVYGGNQSSSSSAYFSVMALFQ